MSIFFLKDPNFDKKNFIGTKGLELELEKIRTKENYICIQNVIYIYIYIFISIMYSLYVYLHNIHIM